MCIAIYTGLIVLLWLYSDFTLESYALSTSSGGNEWMTTALGWEIIPTIWPVILLAMVVASAVTFFIVRRKSCK
jgi:hypothetical protein